MNDICNTFAKLAKLLPILAIYLCLEKQFTLKIFGSLTK